MGGGGGKDPNRSKSAVIFLVLVLTDNSCPSVYKTREELVNKA
jgi:hypothetical protein